MMTPIMASAVQAHEMYEAFKRAGFERREALEIVIRILLHGTTS